MIGLRHGLLVLLIAGAASACKKEEAETPPAATAPSTPTAPEIDLGPEVSLPTADQESIRALLKNNDGWYRTGMTQFGAPAPSINDSPENRAKAPALLWIARHSEEPVEIVAAMRSLAQWSAYDPAVPFPADRSALVLGRLSHPDPHVVAGVADACQHLLKEDAAIQTKLLDLCRNHAHMVVRASACYSAAQRVGSLSRAPETLNTLVAALGDSEAIVHIAVLDRLRYNPGLQELPADTLAKIEPLMTSPTAAVRGVALSYALTYAFTHQSPELDRITGLVAAALRDPDPYVRMIAVDALVQVPTKTFAHVEEMLPLLDQTEVAEAPYTFRGLGFGGPALFGLAEEPADGEARFPANIAASYGSTVQAMTVFYLLQAARGAPEAHRLTAEVPQGSENLEAAKTAVLTWWREHGPALSSQAQP